MKQYLKMADVFVHDSIEELEQHIYAGYMSKHCSEYAAHAINSHDELAQMNQELLDELKAMAKAYVKLLEACKDRIESLGGDCDEVTYMAAHDVDLVHACSVIGKYEGGAA